MDIKQIYNTIRKTTSTNHFWIILGVVGIWVIVLQGFGLFSSNYYRCQSVYVEGGSIDVDNMVPVYVHGGELDVSGSSVEIDGSVWVDGGSINTW